MSRKFGKKNIIKVDPLAYNLGLIGIGGIGKTTLAKNVCEKLVGEDGYIIADVGREDGVDAIAGAVYEKIPDWETFDEFTMDIIENKTTDYKDLKVIVWDTIGELIRIAKPEVISQYNRDQLKKGNSKKVNTINGAWGGFGNGEIFLIDMLIERLWELRRVGVAMFLIGHTKPRTQSDPMTGEEFDILTTDLQYNYFNALKTKLHILGVASIDRNIVKEKTGKTDFKGKDIIKGRVVGESRTITFRDDNYGVDSKSRFSEIVESIPLDADEFIKAIENAIKAEHEKGNTGKSIEESKKEQEVEKNKKVELESKKINEEKELNDINNKIKQFIIDSKKDMEILTPLLTKTKELGLVKPTDITDINIARELVKVI